MNTNSEKSPERSRRVLSGIMVAVIVWGLILAFGAFPYNWLMAAIGWQSRINWGWDQAMVVAVAVTIFVVFWALALSTRPRNEKRMKQAPQMK